MANYTVKQVREVIEGLSDDTPLFGFIIAPADISVWGKNQANGIEDEDTEGYRDPTPEEWGKIVDSADLLVMNGSHSVWDHMSFVMNEAIGYVCPEEEE